MNPATPRALVVEDDRSWQQILSEILADCGLAVDTADNLDQAVLLLKAQPHRLAVLDLSLSPADHNNTDGLRVLEAVRKLDPACRAILLTGFATVELAVSALTEHGAFTFLRKESFHRGQFRELVYRALASVPQPTPSGAAPVSRPGSHPLPQPPAAPVSKESATGKALVVEDDAGWRSILSELLADAGFDVRACGSFGDALGFLRREKFALAVVDLSLSGSVSTLWEQKVPGEYLDRLDNRNLEGYQLLASTRAGGVPTIVVSGVASTEDIQRAYAEQAIFAYLEKQAFERAAFLRIVEEARKARLAGSELSALTEREREVLDLLAQGLTNKEIAEKLFITTNTVKRHLKAVFEKLDVHTRSAAAARAIGEK
jgi:DNA-binding NarL/FixJ family response regulator